MLHTPLATAVISILLAAPFEYIVPVQGRTNPAGQGGWQATVVVLNPSDEQLTLTLEEIYPLNGQPTCPMREREFLIPPRGAARIFATESCGIQNLHALRFTTEKAVIPVNDVTSLATCGGPETVPVETTWFPQDATVLIPRVDLQPGSTRANLVLINPNEEPIIVTYERFGAEGPTEYDVLVPPASLVIHPITAQEFTCVSGGPIGGPAPDLACAVSVRATGAFYAGASVIHNGSNDAVYRRGTVNWTGSEDQTRYTTSTPPTTTASEQ